jgi:outer membrane protein OmpA-like peptidoglycan-associated protein
LFSLKPAARAAVQAQGALKPLAAVLLGEKAMNSKALTKIAAAMAIGVTVAGCQTLDAYTRESETSSATKGAIIGAVSGAVVGLVSGDDAVERRQRALIGAGVGALAGAAIGNYMDKQEAKLRAELEGTGVSVTRIGDNITLNMPGNVTFATDSSDLSPNFFSVLTSVSKVMKEYDRTIVEVAGHTDSDGSHEYNQGLSQRRAGSVAQYLQSQGINSQRMITVGMGETMPIADNVTATGKQANRRVEITMVPITA